MIITFFKQVLRGLLLLFLLIGCNQTVNKEIVEKFENGTPKKIEYFKGDTEKIKVKEEGFYKSGELKYRGSFDGKTKDGLWEFWFENGNLWSKGYFKEGLRSGESKVYHENGELFYSGFYKNGEKHKKWTFYDESGVVVNEITYDNGVLVNDEEN